MSLKIFEMRMCDGSRHFASLSETVFFDVLQDHATTLSGTEITAFVSDWVTEMWLDFEFRGEKFSVNNQYGNRFWKNNIRRTSKFE